MFQRPHHRVAGLLHQVTKRAAAIEPGGNGQHVDEEADRVFKLPLAAAGEGHADQKAGLPGETAEQ